MDAAKLKTALDALTDLVRDVLASEDSNRFSRAAALSTLASKVALHGTPLRTKDALQQLRPNRWGNPGYDAPEMVDADGNGYLNIGPAGEPIQFQMAGNGFGGGHGEDFQRQVLMMVQPLLKSQADTNTARVRADQASELASLVSIRDTIRGDTDEPTSFDGRINELTAALAAPKKETSNADVVPAEPVRGHSPGIAGEGAHQADHLRPVVAGEGGDDGADPGSREGAGAERTLEPRPVSPFRSRLDQGTERGVERLDLEGAEGAHEAPEAEAGADQRGEVRGRQDGGDDREGYRGSGSIPGPVDLTLFQARGEAGDRDLEVIKDRRRHRR